MCSDRTKLWRCALIGTIVYTTILSFIFIIGSRYVPNVKLWQYIAAIALYDAHLVWFPVGIVAIFKAVRQRLRSLAIMTTAAIAAVALATWAMCIRWNGDDDKAVPMEAPYDLMGDDGKITLETTDWYDIETYDWGSGPALKIENRWRLFRPAIK
jgi:hypothetical protein